MKITIKIDNSLDDSEIILTTKKVTPELSSLVSSIESNDTIKIIGTVDDKKYILDVNSIINFYAENNKTYAQDNNKIYVVNYKLYELENILSGTSFIRISNSEIVNFNQIECFSYKDSTIYVYFKNNKFTYVSRRYISKIKEYLKMI